MTATKNETDDKKNESKGPRETPDGTPVVRTIGRDFRVEGNDVDGYVGVSSEYRTYANETERPFTTDGDVELLLRTGQPTDVEMMTMQVAAQKEASGAMSGESEDEKSEDESDKGKSDDESPSKTASKQGQGGTPTAPISANDKQSSTKAAATGTAPKTSN